jgi:hypothetical protein
LEGWEMAGLLIISLIRNLIVIGALFLSCSVTTT